MYFIQSEFFAAPVQKRKVLEDDQEVVCDDGSNAESGGRCKLKNLLHSSLPFL